MVQLRLADGGERLALLPLERLARPRLGPAFAEGPPSAVPARPPPSPDPPSLKPAPRAPRAEAVPLPKVAPAPPAESPRPLRVPAEVAAPFLPDDA